MEEAAALDVGPYRIVFYTNGEVELEYPESGHSIDTSPEELTKMLDDFWQKNF